MHNPHFLHINCLALGDLQYGEMVPCQQAKVTERDTGAWLLSEGAEVPVTYQPCCLPKLREISGIQELAENSIHQLGKEFYA